jgi:hypothetical protein
MYIHFVADSILSGKCLVPLFNLSFRYFYKKSLNEIRIGVIDVGMSTLLDLPFIIHHYLH